MKANFIKTLTIPFALILCECATVTTPIGGPKDETPPVVVNTSPKQNEKNFKRSVVQLNFSEDIKLKDAKEEIIITPSPGKDVTFTTKGKLLIIEPKEGWKENTTYSIAFREGVQDITEGNPVENLRLAFSTGPTIDSLSISGNVKDALTEKIPENITVAIYTSDTFDIFKHAPLYFSKTNKEGNFRLDNLKSDTYHIYAFDDKNKNLKVESQNEQFGFIASVIDLKKNVNRLTIPLNRIDTRKLKMNKPRSTGDIAFLTFNKSVIAYQLQAKEAGLQIPNSFGDDQNEIKLMLKTMDLDSVLMRVTASDSLLQKIDTTVYIKKGKNQKIDEKFTAEVNDPVLEKETGNFIFSITSSKLIKSINTDSITLELDSLVKINFKQEEFKWDTIHKKIELKTTIDKKLIDIEKNILIKTGKNFLETFEDDSIKASSKSVNILSIEETGTLTVEVKPTTQENFIVQLLSGDKVIQFAANKMSHTFKYLEPGNYKIRIIIDTNKNGKWDYGNILQNEEPEKTIYYKDREKKFETPMRANWESSITISF
ncbi:MAG: hypothetical protein DI538_02465 [Azospira oryzae]|jgi:uncharacterized protein (DUF2141 family)|nr:MAG: hypothetical protein DI538_02465 [Azospira oryzae]